MDVNLLREALEITPIDQGRQFVSPSSGDAVMDFVNELGYTEGIITSKNVDYAKLMWEECVQAIQTLLTHKANLGSPTKKGRKDKPHVIPYCEEDEVFGMPIPNELISNNIKNAPYYNAYMEIVANHDRKIAAKKEGKKKPATAKQLKSKLAKEKSSKLASAPKPKVTHAKPAKLSLTKHSKPGKVLKTRKGKSSLQLIDEDEPTQLEPESKPEHQGEGDEHDFKRAIHMSLESFQAQNQAHVHGVAIREPRQTPSTKEASTRPFVDDTSAYILCESPSPANVETGVDADKTHSGGDTEILQFAEEQGEYVDDQVNLEEKTVELDQGQAGSDHGKTPKSRPPPEQEFMDEDQAGPNSGEIHAAFAGSNPEPTHDDFMANVYPNVHESLKFLVDEHVIIEEPLSSTGTLFSIKNLDDAYTIGDQFLNDKSTKDDPGKLNVEAKVVSMVIVQIYQASSSAPPLSTPVIDLSPPKPVSLTTQAPIFTATTTTTTTLPLPPPPQQQSTTDSKLMFESGSYKSLPEHIALYEALEASMKRANRDEFYAEKDKSRKRSHDDQNPPPPPLDSDPIEDVPMLDIALMFDLEDTDSAHLLKIRPRPEWLKPILEEDRPTTPEPDWFCKRTGKKKMSKADLEGLAFKVVKAFHENSHRLVPDLSKPLPLRGLPGQVTIQPQFFFDKYLEYLISCDTAKTDALSISKLKAANYPNFGLEELVPSLWIESERDYNVSATYSITHWLFKRKYFYIIRYSAPSDRRAVRSHMRILSVISIKTFERYEYAFLKEIIIREADYNEYKIFEADFKNLHPNDFEDLNIVIRQRVKDLQLGIESYHTKLNLTEPRWNASDFLFKEDYTIISKPGAVIYRDRNDQKKMMRENVVHKFSYGTLTRVLHKLDHMVKDFRLYQYNSGIEYRIWSEDDKKRSEEFMENIRVIPKYHGEDGNPASANIKQALGRSCTSKRAEVYYKCMDPFKSLMSLWVRNKSIAAIWLEKVVTPLIEPANKGFTAALAVLKPERFKVYKHGMSEPMS
nr:hypothetical protein [Tanacetum cinerariifolium]